MQFGFLAFLFVVGACFGSFLCCQARRMHNSETGHRSLGKRSVCLHCKKQLRWQDDVPIFSWLFLRGKCHYCHKKIGLAEILSEFGMGVGLCLLGNMISVTSASLMDWALFVFVVLLTLVFGFLAIYDGLYGELPGTYLTISLVLSVVILCLKEWAMLLNAPFSIQMVWQPFASVLLIGGIYLLLYLISKGKWVGDGDWLIGTAIAIALFDPWLALIALFATNFLAATIMYPFVRKTKKRKIHLGPFMVMAFVITYSFSGFFLSLLS